MPKSINQVVAESICAFVQDYNQSPNVLLLNGEAWEVLSKHCEDTLMQQGGTMPTALEVMEGKKVQYAGLDVRIVGPFQFQPVSVALIK